MAKNDNSPRTGLTRREFLGTAVAAVSAAGVMVVPGLAPNA
jgi:hypothetical protein